MKVNVKRNRIIYIETLELTKRNGLTDDSGVTNDKTLGCQVVLGMMTACLQSFFLFIHFLKLDDNFSVKEMVNLIKKKYKTGIYKTMDFFTLTN